MANTATAEALLLIAMAASLSSTIVMSKESRFTWADCQTSALSSPSPASSPSSSLSSINSTFWSNVVTLLSALPSAAAPTGFASLFHGNGTNRAFVRGMCRGDSMPANCAKHLQNAAVALQSRCNSSRRAAIWFDDGSTMTYPAPMFCFVSYADTNESTSYEDGYRQELQNTNQVSDKNAFESTYSALMTRLAERVVSSGGSSAAAPSPAPMFATGEVVFDPSAPNGTMYGLLQCMRHRTAAECDECLKGAVRALPICCNGSQGGAVLAYNCYLRMEIYTYYDLALDGAPFQLAPAPSPAPSIIVGGTRGIKKVGATLLATLAVATVLAAVVIFGVFHYRRKVIQKQTPQDNGNTEEQDTGCTESKHLNMLVLRAATNNFSNENKLREGGFGEVFKGILPDGQEIAVKKLSHNSTQGLDELKNELVLAAKLKHRNLVQLLGVCLQEEKLLIYEYMPNRSLDTFLFDPIKRQQLDWSKRFAIICGIARGLLEPSSRDRARRRCDTGRWRSRRLKT